MSISGHWQKLKLKNFLKIDNNRTFWQYAFDEIYSTLEQ
jgi:hypothetical protein